MHRPYHRKASQRRRQARRGPAGSRAQRCLLWSAESRQRGRTNTKSILSKHRSTGISSAAIHSIAVALRPGFGFPTFGTERAGSGGSAKARTSEAMRCSARRAPNQSRGGKPNPGPGATDQERSTSRAKNTRHHGSRKPAVTRQDLNATNQKFFDTLDSRPANDDPAIDPCT